MSLSEYVNQTMFTNVFNDEEIKTLNFGKVIFFVGEHLDIVANYKLEPWDRSFYSRHHHCKGKLFIKDKLLI